MADIIYTVNQDIPENIVGFEQYSQQDKDLVNSFQVNSVFDTTTNYIELHILSLSDELLESDYDYTRHTQLGNAQSAGQTGASVLTVDPILDAKSYGYENGGVKLLYHFLNDLYTRGKDTREFFIQSISSDRLEIALDTLTLAPEELDSYTSEIKNKVAGLSYFTGYRLNFKNNDLVISTNIDIIELEGRRVVVAKLYEPLPTIYDIKSTLNIVEEVSDSAAYEVDSEITLQQDTIPTLRSANFNIDIADESVVPTQYFNYTELLSYPVSNANNQIFSAVNEKSIDINVDYSTFSDFVHFSSAQERLLNFKYKLDLVNNYYNNLNAISGSTTGLQGVSGSIKYYEGLITGIVGNFDHYERFLYYESGSTSWPKSNTTKPYTNQESTTSEAATWYADQIAEAIYFDQTNYSSLVYSIPAYLRDDVNNENYLTFVYMVGQHFDNLWLYSKAVTDKYDADNRPNFGISKDLVAEALKNFGVKLYTSNKSVEDLFTTFIGQAYQSGSELINNYITGSLTGSNTPIQPTAYSDYQKEVQKRIYHNLPLLLKAKGTERGVRALINCFGISSDILNIRLYGGSNQQILPLFGDQQYLTSSLDKIRIDHTGSLVAGSTLSGLTSIIKRDQKYTDDLHNIEVGFSPTDNINKYIVNNSTGSFSLDDYLGDARNLTSDKYSGLYEQATSILGTLDKYDLQDYVRLIKFFDNTVFKMIKDFIPARAVATTGIIIKPNLLNVSKAKSVIASATQPEYSGSINTAFISGSDGGVYKLSTEEFSTAWSGSIQTPFGLALRLDHTQEEPKFNGELSGSLVPVSNGELNVDNTLKIQTPTPLEKVVHFYLNAPTDTCSLKSTLTPFYITEDSYLEYPIELDLVSAYYTGITYTTKPTSLQTLINTNSGLVNFPGGTNDNYITYEVTASKPALSGCISSASYIVQYRDLEVDPTISHPTVQISSIYDVASWFIVGRNTATKFYEGTPSLSTLITSPESYKIINSIGSTITITAQDDALLVPLTKSTSAIVTAIPVLYECCAPAISSIVSQKVGTTFLVELKWTLGVSSPSTTCILSEYVRIQQSTNGGPYTDVAEELSTAVSYVGPRPVLPTNYRIQAKCGTEYSLESEIVEYIPPILGSVLFDSTPGKTFIELEGVNNTSDALAINLSTTGNFAVTNGSVSMYISVTGSPLNTSYGSLKIRKGSTIIMPELPVTTAATGTSTSYTLAPGIYEYEMKAYSPEPGPNYVNVITNYIPV